MLSISITVSLFAMSMAWGMAPGSVSKARWLACGAGAPLALLVVLGWCQLMGALGLAAPALAAVTSPACVSFVHELRRTANERRLARLRRWERMILDKELADRRFAQIVERLERSEKSLDS